jgi:hypothetical protein
MSLLQTSLYLHLSWTLPSIRTQTPCLLMLLLRVCTPETKPSHSSSWKALRAYHFMTSGGVGKSASQPLVWHGIYACSSLSAFLFHRLAVHHLERPVWKRVRTCLSFDTLHHIYTASHRIPECSSGTTWERHSSNIVCLIGHSFSRLRRVVALHKHQEKMAPSVSPVICCTV